MNTCYRLLVQLTAATVCLVLPLAAEQAGSLNESLDNNDLTITSGGTIPWIAQTDVTHDGVDAACSGEISDDGESWMETHVTGPATLSYWRKVSSELRYDYLELYIDGELHSAISGEVDWQPVKEAIPAGDHTVRWRYCKDVIYSSGQDRAWIDQVTVGPPGPPPSVTTGPATWLEGSTTTLTGTVETHGFATTVQFEYGTTTAYDSVATTTLSGSNVSVDLGPLPAGTTYHYRIVASNGIDTSVGADRQFVTERRCGDFAYTTSDASATVIFCTSALQHISIPATLDGTTVTSIGYQAFFNSRSLISVTMPSSITSIGVCAFGECPALTQLELPSELKTIGRNAFQHCTSLAEVAIPASVTSIGVQVFFYCDHLTAITVDPANASYSSVDGVLFDKEATILITYPGGKSGPYTIPFGVTTIMASAFELCSQLTSVTLSSSVISVGDLAFCYCYGLQNVSIPTGVASIGWYAFYQCANLANVTIPASINLIGDGAFSSCAKLMAITVDEANTSYSSLDDVLFNKARTLLIQYPGGKWGDFVIPSGVGLTTFAFWESAGLTGITIPSGINRIESDTFFGCSALKNITVPSSVTYIGRAFLGCDNLLSFTVDELNPNYSSLDGVLFNKEKTLLVQYPIGRVGAYTTPAGLVSIADYAFSGCRGLTSVTLSPDVTDIGVWAFSYCSGLRAIVFAGDAPAIGWGALRYAAPELTLFYRSGTMGFTSPTWEDYPAVEVAALPGSPLELWRLINFGIIESLGIAADAEDPDQDGKTNADEFAGDTDPNNGADFFHVITTRKTADSFIAKINGKAGRSYVLQRKESLSDPLWLTVAATDIVVTEGPLDLIDAAPPAGQAAFYRVKVDLP